MKVKVYIHSLKGQEYDRRVLDETEPNFYAPFHFGA